MPRWWTRSTGKSEHVHGDRNYKTGDDVAKDGKRLRTLFLTYEAEDSAADTFMVVLGSVAENFRGIEVVEYQDDTAFAEDEDAMATLHRLATGAERLAPEQQAELDAFVRALGEWDGKEAP
jgi:hypothetical protein